MIKIYKLIHNGQIVYVGQTKLKYLSRRKAIGYGNTVPFYKECKMELIEETDDVSRERYWIERLRSEGHPLLNKRGGDGLDLKEYYKEYYQNNKEKIKEYYQKDEVQVRKKKYHKEYCQNNKEKKREYDREYKKNKKLISNP